VQPFPEKKQVRFQVRVKIHEFEKYLEEMSDPGNGDDSRDDSSSINDGDEDDDSSQQLVEE
jgi:hypothetical protein